MWFFAMDDNDPFGKEIQDLADEWEDWTFHQKEWPHLGFPFAVREGLIEAYFLINYVSENAQLAYTREINPVLRQEKANHIKDLARVVLANLREE